MRQVIISGSSNPLNNAATEFNSITFHNNFLWTTNETARQELSPANCKIRSLIVQLTAAPGAGTSYTFTVRIGGSDTDLTVTISDTDTRGYIFDQDVTLSTEDLVCISCTPSNTPGTPSATWSVELETEGDTKTVIINGQQDLLDSAIPLAINWVAGGSDWVTSSASSINNIELPAIGGTFKDVYVWLDGTAGPTGADGWNFTIAGISLSVLGSNTTANDTTSTTTVSAGDNVQMSASPAGTPTNRRVKWGITFIADSEDFPIMGGSTNDLNPAATEYNQLNSANFAWTPTETDRRSLTMLATYKNLIIKTAVAPGAGTSYTFTVMKNGLPTNLTVTLSDTNRSASNLTDELECDDFDELSLECAPSNTPAAINCAWTISGRRILPFPNSLMLVNHGR